MCGVASVLALLSQAVEGSEPTLFRSKERTIQFGPATLKTAHGPLVTLPYSLEQNDIPMMIVQHHRSEEMWQRTKDAFDRLYLEGAETARVLAIAIHPYISGVPHRIKYLEAAFEYMQGHEGVLFWTGERILDWYVKLRDEK